MSKRGIVGLAYFCSMASLVGVRILFSLVNFNTSFISRNDLFSILTQVVCLFIIPVSIYYGFYKKRDRNYNFKTLLKEFGYVKFDRRHLKNVIIISILAAFVTTCISTAWQNFLSVIGYIGNISSGATTMSGYRLVLSLIFTAVFPTLFEEFTNRGLLFAGFKKNKALKTILVSALLFALMHQNITQVVYTFFGGVCMAALCYYTRSIYPAMFFHFTNNFFSVLQNYGAANGGLFNIINALYSMLFGSVLGLLTTTILFIGAIYAIVHCFKEIKTLALKKIPVRVYDTIIYESRFFDFSVYSGLPQEPKPTTFDNLFFYAAILLNVAATAFTLIWGLML